MATQIDPKEIDLQEQMASIRRHMAEIDQRQIETKFEPRKFWLSAVATAAGLLGAGAAIGGVFVNYLGN